jgi:regulator of protease activity HflC (stomatin/prohibitin superfamily)
MLFSPLAQSGSGLLGLGPTLLCILGVAVLLAIFFLASAIRIVPEYQRLVVFRVGRCIGAKGPGIVLLIPFGIDRGVRVDLREVVREVPHQTSITKDNAPISIDFLWYYKVLEPTDSVLQVGNFVMAAEGIATTTLRSVIGGINLDDVLSEREHINNMLRTRLDEVTERWGVKVTNVEIREIVPPREVQEAMNRQMSAERIRRAVVTESTGTREAAINVAEGEKQSAILRAEGQKQSAILEAEGQRQAQELRAEGFAAALDRIFAIAQTVDQKTMTLQYFDTLKTMGTSAATKFIFPMEFTSMLSNFMKGQAPDKPENK